MKNVALIGPSSTLFKGGITHFTEELYNILSKKDDVVIDFIPFTRNYPPLLYKGSQPSGKIQKGWDWLNPLSYIQVAKRIKTLNADIVILQWWTFFWGIPYLFLLLIMKLFKTDVQKHIVIHNVYDHECSALSKLFSKIVLPFFDLYIVHSKGEYDKLAKLLRDKSKIKLQQMPVFNMFKKKPHSIVYKKKSADEKIMLFFGHVRPYKGLDLLIESLSKLNKNDFAFHLLVAGEFWNDKEAYIKQIKKYNLEDYITLFDKYIPDDEVPNYFNSADAVIMPYKKATGTAVSKVAHFFNKPIIATPVGDLAQSSHFVAESTSINDFVKVLKRFFKYKNIRPNKSKINNTTWKIYTKSLLSI